MSGLIRQAMASTGSPTLWRRISSATCSVARTRQCQKARVSGRHPASARDRLEGRRAGWPYRRQPANAREARHDPGSTEAAGAAGRHRHAHALLRHRRALSGRSHRGVPAAAGAGRRLPGGATAPGPRARRGRSTVGLRHRQPLHHGCGGGARRWGAGGGRGRPQRERCRAGAPHGGGRARHPLPHAQGRRAALGNPGGHGGARASVRLARAAAVQRPRAARAGSDAEAPPGRSGDRSRRPVHGSGAAEPPRIFLPARPDRERTHLGQAVRAV